MAGTLAEELIFRGKQYARAILAFQKRYGRAELALEAGLPPGVLNVVVVMVTFGGSVASNALRAYEPTPGQAKTVSVNGREYQWPRAPLVVICCDGSEPDYMEIARANGLNVATDLDTILADSTCYNCLSDREMKEVEITILWDEYANGVDFQTLIDESKCLKCLDPKKVRAAILVQLYNSLNPIIT